MAQKRNARDLTQGPVFGHLMRMVIPMSFGIVAMMLVGIVDAYWVGRLGTVQQAAVQFVFPVSMAVMSIAIGLGAGAVSVVARAAGRGDGERTKRVATDAVLLALLITAITSAIGIALIGPLFRLMGASEAMMPFVHDYMTIWFAGIIFMVGPMIASNILRALGDAILPSIIMIIAAVLNMILDPILIFGLGPVPAMEVQGAALATLISNLVVFIVAMAIMIFREKIIDLSWPGFSEMAWNWGEIARIGAPAAGSNMINPMAMTLVFAAAAQFGEPVVAGFGVAGRVEALALIPLFALSGSIGPVTGQNGGAGHIERVREAFRSAFLFCAGWGVAMAALLAALAYPLSWLFLPSDEAQAMARLTWWIAPVTMGGYGIAMAAAAGFNGLGRPLLGVGVNLMRCFLLLVPLVWLGAIQFGPAGMISGYALANVLAGAVTAFLVLRYAPMSAVESKARPVVPPTQAARAGVPVKPAE
ncbi:MATE family efflux transporter [Glycocaulis albus]|uniref:MATE family efflux transporter n=1 Tax=Glycocaulis albus TaxID=1382801 RepID=A0ABQ1XG31_9PROT|nr:MATE family efflux transporter [Glycocaulis albus]MBV5258426.1 MATE family efflux transporter [Synechococcus moorigangaii CMS01]GGG92594.1 MATE family efflux transporter [Glycocaulis albus]